MVNVTSKGNYTLIQWAILPAGSSKFMSYATAMVVLHLISCDSFNFRSIFLLTLSFILFQEIINRLTEHRIQLPENLGSYQLLEWNVAPPSNR
jgi:hypothetical protein